MMILDLPEDDLEYVDEDLRLNDFDDTLLNESAVTDTLESSRVETPTSDNNFDFRQGKGHSGKHAGKTKDSKGCSDEACCTIY